MSVTSRFYATNSAAAFEPPPASPWDDSTVSVFIAGSKTKSGTAATVAGSGNSSTPSVQLASIVVPLVAAYSFSASDTLNWVLGIKEANAALNAYWRVFVWVSAGHTETSRGTLLDWTNSTTEFTTTATGRYLNSSAKTLASVSAQAGDCVVIEVGFDCSTTGDYAATLNYGNTGSTDLTDGSTSVTTEPGWLEFVTASDPWTLAKSLSDSAAGADARVASVTPAAKAESASASDARHASIGPGAKAEAATAADSLAFSAHLPQSDSATASDSLAATPYAVLNEAPEALDGLVSVLTQYNPGPFGGHGLEGETESTRYALRSYGRPGFAVYQTVPSSAPFYFSGIGVLLLEFDARFDSCPEVIVSGDEPHVLLSDAPADDVADGYWIGATPDGRLCGGYSTSTVLKSGVGAVVIDNKFHTYSMRVRRRSVGVTDHIEYAFYVDGACVSLHRVYA